MTLGYILNTWMVFNKKLWTLSFAIETSGISGLALACCFLILDFRQIKYLDKITQPLVWMGMNPLVVYFG